MSDTRIVPGASRRGLLARGTAALLAGAAIATTAHAAPVTSLAGAGADAELIALCTEFDDCERQLLAIYEAHWEDDPPGALPLMERQVELTRCIMDMSAHSAAGIVAIARSVALHNGEGAHDFDPTQDTTTGRLMTALMREVCLLSGLPAPSALAGRVAA